MTKYAQNIENSIRDFLFKEGLLKEKIIVPDLKFGFQFTFPLFTESSEEKGQLMVIYQPLNKNFLIISIATQISEYHTDILMNSSDKKNQFFIDIKKIILLKNLFFRLDIDNDCYEISDQIFIDPDKPLSKNGFYKTIRKLYNVQVYCNLLLMEYCAEKLDPEEIKKMQGIDTNIGSNLYI
ncbi:MAG: DUF2299 family protein [Candidatus Lokiarchaeota archaeon]|nr:DUF2299 family protein [Candidatus Lokiarchaeota archaeon]